MLPVAKKIDTTKTAMMTETTKNGEEMCMVGKLLAVSRIPAVSFQISAFSLQRFPPEPLYDQPSGPALIAHDFDNLAES